MTDRKAIATIDTEIGTMTVYYNGAGEEMTAERGEHIEKIGYTPKSYDDAADAVHAMYSTGPWCLEWIED